MCTEVLKQGRSIFLVTAQSLDNRGIVSPAIVFVRLTQPCVFVILCVPIASQDCHRRVDVSYREQK